MVQQKAAIMSTTSLLVTSVMEEIGGQGLEKQGSIKDFRQFIIDEKALHRDCEYSTLAMGSCHDYVLEMTEGRKDKSVKALLFTITEEETFPDLRLVNIKMIEDIAPKAKIVHDKFQLMKMLTEATDKPRKSEVRFSESLKGTNYMFFRNKSTMKLLMYSLEASISKNITSVTKLIETIERHLPVERNAINTGTSNGKHANMNGSLQSLILKLNEFYNYKSYSVQVLFHYNVSSLFLKSILFV